MFLYALIHIVHLGGEIVSTFGHPELVKLGECKVIEEVMIGEDKVSVNLLLPHLTPAACVIFYFWLFISQRFSMKDLCNFSWTPSFP